MANFGIFLRVTILYLIIQSNVQVGSKDLLIETEDSPVGQSAGLDGPGDYESPPRPPKSPERSIFPPRQDSCKTIKDCDCTADVHSCTCFRGKCMYGDFMYFDFDENCKTALDCQCPFIGPCNVGCKNGKCIDDPNGGCKTDKDCKCINEGQCYCEEGRCIQPTVGTPPIPHPDDA